jgi:hypothetical protein
MVDARPLSDFHRHGVRSFTRPASGKSVYELEAWALFPSVPHLRPSVKQNPARYCSIKKKQRSKVTITEKV